MFEIDMIETRPNRIELKLLTNKYRNNYNHHHVLKFDTAQKLDIIDATEFDSSTALYYLVNLVARILKKSIAFVKSQGCDARNSKFTQREKKNIWFSRQYQFHNLRSMRI